MATINLGKVKVTPEGLYDSSKSYAELSLVGYEGSSYISIKDVPAGTLPTNTSYWQLHGSKGADGANGADGNDGIDAYQPFKGWYDASTSLSTAFPTPQVGDYAYVAGSTSSDPVTIYRCTTAGTWAASSSTFNPANNQEFASGQSLNTVNIVDNLTSSSATDVLSAKQGKELKGQIDALGPKLSQKAVYVSRNYALMSTGKYGTNTAYQHGVFPVSAGDIVRIISTSSTCRYALTTATTYNSGADIPFVDGTSIFPMEANKLYEVVIPSGCNYFMFNDYDGTNVYKELNIKQSFDDVDSEVAELDRTVNGTKKNYVSGQIYDYQTSPKGQVSPTSYGIRSDYIPASPGDVITWHSGCDSSKAVFAQFALVCYDSELNILFTVKSSSVEENTFIISSGYAAAYIRASFVKSKMNECFIKINGKEVYRPSENVDGIAAINDSVEVLNELYSSLLTASNGTTNTDVQREENRVLNNGYIEEGSGDSAYQVRYYPQSFNKGDVIRFQGSCDSSRSISLFATQTDLSQLEALLGQHVDVLATKTMTGVWDMAIVMPYDGYFGYSIRSYQWSGLKTTRYELTALAELVTNIAAIEQTLMQETTVTKGTRTSTSYFSESFTFRKGYEYLIEIASGEISGSTTHVLSKSTSNITSGTQSFTYGIKFTCNDDGYVCIYQSSIVSGSRPFSWTITEFAQTIIEHERRITALENQTPIDTGVVSLNSPAETILKFQQWRKRIANNHVDTGKKRLVLLHFSDLHGSQSNLSRIIDYYNAYSTYIDDVLHTGDHQANTYENSFSYWSGTSGAENILNCIGNHDTANYDSTTGYDWTAHAGADAYGKFFAPYIDNWNVTQPSDAATEGKCYYYKDYATANVRLIVLDAMSITKDGDAAQIAWFESVLADAITQGLHVVGAYHYGTMHEVIQCSFSNVATGMPSGLPTSVLECVDAFIENGGHFVCWLAGHSHVDRFGTLTATVYGHKQAVLQVSTANGSDINQSDSGDVRRVSGTKSFDLFNMVCVDTVNGRISVFRVGADFDAASRHIGTICYDYENHQLLASW